MATLITDSSRLAGFAWRSVAFVTDMAVISAACKIIFQLFNLPTIWVPSQLIPGFDSVSNLIAVTLLWGYNILMLKYFGATLGKMVFGLRVVKQDGTKLDWITVIIRETIGKMISVITGFIGFISVSWDRKKQAFHDKIADTLVLVK